jgi:hypothetical protein
MGSELFLRFPRDKASLTGERGREKETEVILRSPPQLGYEGWLSWRTDWSARQS